MADCELNEVLSALNQKMIQDALYHSRVKLSFNTHAASSWWNMGKNVLHGQEGAEFYAPSAKH